MTPVTTDLSKVSSPPDEELLDIAAHFLLPTFVTRHWLQDLLLLKLR